MRTSFINLFKIIQVLSYFFLLVKKIRTVKTTKNHMCQNVYFDYKRNTCNTCDGILLDGQCFEKCLCKNNETLQILDKSLSTFGKCVKISGDGIKKNLADDALCFFNNSNVCINNSIFDGENCGRCIDNFNYVNRLGCIPDILSDLSRSESLDDVYPTSDGKFFHQKKWHERYIKIEQTPGVSFNPSQEDFGLNVWLEKIKCSAGLIQSCQFLINLCTLHMFNDEVCENELGLSSLLKKKNYSYYISETVINDQSLVDFEVSFDKKTKSVNLHELEYYIAKWDKKGNYLGMHRLRHELNLCTKTYEDSNDFYLFGATSQKICNVSLIKMHESEPYFYELYLRNSKTNKMIDSPIPVLVYNSNNQNGRDNLNGEVDFENIDQIKFYRRFFTVFPIAKESKFAFAQTIELKTKLQNIGGSSKIYLPYLKIIYNVATTSDQYTPQVIFRSDYYMDMDNLVRGFMIIFWVLLIIVIFMVFCRMYVWTILNPQRLSRDVYVWYFLINFLMKLFKFYGAFAFFYSWGVTAYLYIFYKLQYRPYILLWSYDYPYNKFDEKFNIIWGLGCTCYGLYMFFRIYQQCNFDIFFVDWEHDKNLLMANGNDKAVKTYKGAWRAIHVANQFNILQKERTISIPFCFCCLLMFWYSPNLHWNRYAQDVPNVTWVSDSPEHILLRHFVVSFILFVSGVCQYVLRRLIQFVYPMKKVEFRPLFSQQHLSLYSSGES